MTPRIRADEVARLAGMSVRWVQMEAAAGRIPGAARFGKSLDLRRRGGKAVDRRARTRGGMSAKGDDHLYRRGKVWWLAYKGQRHSLRTSSVRVARERRGAEIERIDRALWGDRRRTWQEAVVKWATESAPESLAQSARRRYGFSLKMAESTLGALFLDEIGRRQLAEVAGRAGVSNATRRRDLNAISAVLRAAVGWGWIEVNPVRIFDRGIIPERCEPIVLPGDAGVARFLAATPDELRPLVRLLELTGMRLEEAGGLTWRRVDLARRAVQIQHSKGRRPRAVPLDAEAVSLLGSVARHLGTDLVFWTDQREPRRHVNLSSRLAKIRAKAGVAMRTHDLRHLFAVRYLRNGGSVYDLQMILGHSTIATTEGYLDFLTPDEATRAKRLGGTAT